MASNSTRGRNVDTHSLFATGLAACCALLLNTSAALGQQSGAQQKCLNSVNKDGSKVSKAQGKENSSCLKQAGKNQLVGTAQACLTADPKLKVQSKKDKTIADDAANCGTAPDFGYTGATTVNTAAVQAQLDLVAASSSPPSTPRSSTATPSGAGFKWPAESPEGLEKLAAKNSASS